MNNSFAFKYLLSPILVLAIYSSASAQITQVTSFGTNPGALNMYTHIPSGISGAAPLVIALHGCTETAADFSAQSGWDKLADLHKFYVVYPEQVAANNSELCFNWFDTTDVNRNVGEALSIKQMVDYMKANYSINASEVYVTGLSAGAAMTAVMMAAYPDVFVSGAIMSGLPYKAATNSTAAIYAMDGYITMTPAQWGALVRAQNPSFTSAYPHMAVFQGTADLVVDSINATQLIKQWTNLDHANQIPDSSNNAFQGNTNVRLTIYNDSSNNPVVYHYMIIGMPHGIAVDTGACPRQGGETATYAIEETNFHSTYWAAQFFNLIPGPYSITGPITVSSFGTNKIYSVPSTAGSTYLWTVPPGATIVSGQGTNTITVDFSSHSGYVTVTETETGGCKLDPAKLYVTVGTSTGIEEVSNAAGKVYYNAADNSLNLLNINHTDVKLIGMVNVLGQTIDYPAKPTGNKILLGKKPARGIYFITVLDSERQYVTKIVVE